MIDFLFHFVIFAIEHPLEALSYCVLFAFACAALIKVFFEIFDRG